MPVTKVVPAADAVLIARSGDVVATSGYGGYGVPEEILVALEERFVATGDPRDLTLVYAGGQGDGGVRGLNHLGHRGFLKRVVAGHYGLVPKIAQLVVDEQVEAYNLPEGIIVHLYRSAAAGTPGLLSTIGSGTFVDPRLEGGKVNASAVDDVVELVEFGGENWLFYRAFPIDLALVRGTTADPEGNVTMEREPLSLEVLSLAIAAKTSGGHVLCQVERIAEAGSLDSRDVVVPAVLVDAVVVAEPENHMQSFGTQYDAGVAGEIRVPPSAAEPMAFGDRKVIARRAALDLVPDGVVNVGIGLPSRIGAIAAEENIEDLVTFTVDPGVFGGVPTSGLDFGAAVNRQAVIDHASMFDFVDGGGLDTVFLGVAQVDGRGDVNVSRFGDALAGCGGVINLTHRTPNVVFMTTFTAGGLRTSIENGELRIVEEGRIAKFVGAVDQITFCAERARGGSQSVSYVTERCVFAVDEGGLVLTEVAPGIDVERDVLARLPFPLRVDGPAAMERALFLPGPLGLRERMLDVHIEERLTFDAETNTVFMDFVGMHIRTKADAARVVAAVDDLLGPLGHKVNSIVNYDRFVLDDEAVDAWADAVQYVSERYYLKVSRHTRSGFLRLKLDHELSKRRVASELYDSAEEARDHLEQ